MENGSSHWSLAERNRQTVDGDGSSGGEMPGNAWGFEWVIAQNKANFLCFWGKNEDSVKKQSQSKRAPS